MEIIFYVTSFTVIMADICTQNVMRRNI